MQSLILPLSDWHTSEEAHTLLQGKPPNPGSNIRSFQQRFTILETDPEVNSYMPWLFRASRTAPQETLVEDTRLCKGA